MSEQQVATELSKCPHPEAVGRRWGDPISPERQQELQAILDAWNAPGAEHSDRKSPFVFLSNSEVALTGADVFWLAVQRGLNSLGEVPKLHFEGVVLNFAHLEGATLGQAHLEGASIIAAHLQSAYLSEAHLEGALLCDTHLEGANLSETYLEGANLSRCWLDSTTMLSNATFDRATTLGDIQWDGVGAVNLTRIDWERVPTLGDERGIGFRAAKGWHAAVVRAYRQLAAQLRAQGMNEVADSFLHRAQTRQRWAHLSILLHDWRRPWRWLGDLGRYLGSLFLAVLAGYGYRPGRTLFWYVMTVLSFLCGFWLVTHGVPLFGLTEPAGTQPLHWYEALVLSLTSFHGRGFFPQGISLGDPVAILAACEAVIGLFIEISFIATFTQRYLGGK